MPYDMSDPTPYFPMVKAIAPKAPMGARTMTMRTIPNMPLRNMSSMSMNGRAGCPIRDSAAPSSTANRMICSTFPSAKEPTTVLGMTFMMKSTAPACCVSAADV